MEPEPECHYVRVPYVPEKNVAILGRVAVVDPVDHGVVEDRDVALNPPPDVVSHVNRCLKNRAYHPPPNNNNNNQKSKKNQNNPKTAHQLAPDQHEHFNLLEQITRRM